MVLQVLQSLSLLWSSPLTILLSLSSLWTYLGPSCLAGLAVMLLLIPINAALASTMRRCCAESHIVLH